jgi:hypothetical protein
MPVKLNDRSTPAAPKPNATTNVNVNPSLPGPAGVERAHGHGHGHPHSHDQGKNQVFNVTVDDTAASQDVDQDCGEDGDCETNSKKRKLAPDVWN